MIEDLTVCFTGFVDPRVTRRCDHRLIDILVIAVIACGESWRTSSSTGARLSGILYKCEL